MMFRPQFSKQNTPENASQLKQTQLFTNYVEQSSSSNQHCFQTSRAVFKSQIDPEVIIAIQSGYFKDECNAIRHSSIFARFQEDSCENYSYFQEQSFFPIAKVSQSYSEQFELKEQPQSISSFQPKTQKKQNDVQVDQRLNRPQLSEKKTINKGDQIQSNLQLNSNNSQSKIKDEKIESRQCCTGILAKNVTKNMGKLLFKYIWKNKKCLQQALCTDTQIWENLMSMIRSSKKENNVTRQFLISRFHGQGNEAKLFRVIAHHFFRKCCLAAIFKSKIAAKRIHFQRIQKFDQALIDPKALDYLA